MLGKVLKDTSPKLSRHLSVDRPTIKRSTGNPSSSINPYRRSAFWVCRGSQTDWTGEVGRVNFIDIAHHLVTRMMGDVDAPQNASERPDTRLLNNREAYFGVPIYTSGCPVVPLSKKSGCLFEPQSARLRPTIGRFKFLHPKSRSRSKVWSWSGFWVSIRAIASSVDVTIALIRALILPSERPIETAFKCLRLLFTALLNAWDHFYPLFNASCRRHWAISRASARSWCFLSRSGISISLSCWSKSDLKSLNPQCMI